MGKDGFSMFGLWNARKVRIIAQRRLSGYSSQIMFPLSIVNLIVFIILLLEIGFLRTLWYHRLSSEVEGFVIRQERVNGQDVAQWMDRRLLRRLKGY
ncbi:hypothetical protein AVEN_211650-1 [Araneus ventricosus]|uniref:Uncharacterized protein n=1 Tax=Araneus ventricosus TaxID=182803 RepID=A0A4Y2WZ87_ARAVE|nr:hypothetical protein AVEN_199581-1 [Araneus ventricosus]GBO42582.1 hypothetical protein AVEN_211650-1 [Araneus ventricosus]